MTCKDCFHERVCNALCPKGLLPYQSAEYPAETFCLEFKPTSDVVPVVRCRDCESYNTFGCADGFGWCENFNNGVTDEHYCSYGERETK